MGRCIRKFTELDWITDEGHTAQTTDIKRVTGNLRKIEVKVSSVTDNPTVDVTLSDISDTDFVTELIALSTLADGTLHVFNSRSKEFVADADIDEMFFNLNDLRISVDPSADPGGVAQTLTVNVKLYLD